MSCFIIERKLKGRNQGLLKMQIKADLNQSEPIWPHLCEQESKRTHDVCKRVMHYLVQIKAPNSIGRIKFKSFQQLLSKPWSQAGKVGKLYSSHCIRHSISGTFSVVMGYDNRECGYVDTCQNFCRDMALHCCYICFQMFTFCWICSHFKHCPKFL